MTVAPPEDRLDLHPLLEAVFRALDGAGITWCLLRGAEDLAVPAGDVDVLVARADAGRVAAAVAPAGLTHVPSWGYGSHRFYFGYDPRTDAWLKLDVVSELAFGPWFSLRSDAAAACLRRRRRHGAVAILDDADAFWCLLLHRLADKGSIGATGPRLAGLAAADGAAESPLAVEVDRLGVGGWRARRVLDAANVGEWAELEALRPALLAAWTRRRPLSTRRRRLTGRVARRCAPLVRARRGLTVALVGLDGAGKSTAAAGIARSFPFPVSTVYMSPAPRARARSSPRGLSFALLLGAQLRRWARAQEQRARGRLVLFDRYAYDALMPARRAVNARGRLRRWLLGHACPAPALTVLLDAPADVLYARKPEHPPAVLETEREAYLRLARSRRATVIDATADADRVRRDVTATIWAAYQPAAGLKMRLRPGASARSRHSRSSVT